LPARPTSVSNVGLERQRAAEPARQESAADPAGAGVSPNTARGVGLLRYGVVGFAVLAVVGLLALLGYGMLRRQGGGFAGFSVNTVGKVAEVKVRPAPDFALQFFGGQSFRLSEQRGRGVVVNYWASWCPPCREEARTLEATWRTYRDRGILLIGVDVWDSETDARAFLREFGVTYPNGPDPTGGILIEYGVTGIPETYFIDRDGQLLRRWVGPLTERQIAAFIEELLPPPAPPPRSLPLRRIAPGERADVTGPRDADG